MATKPWSGGKRGDTCRSLGKFKKDKHIIALEKRIAFLEKELRQKCDASFADPTGGKLAKAVLEQQLELTQTMLDAIPIPVFYKGVDGVYTGCNQAFAEYIGKPRDQIIGSTVFDVSPPELAEVYHDADEALIRRPGAHQYECIVVDAAGVKHDVVFNKATFRNNNGTMGGLVGIIFDVTERKQAEVALRESEERLRLCIATARLGTYDWDVVNDRHIWSPETYEIYGLPPDAPLTIGLLKEMIYPGDKQDDVVAAELDPATSHGGYSLEYRIIRASDRSVRWINTKTRIIFTGEGAERRAVRVLGVIQDITERKQAEHALQESEDRLQLCIATARLGFFDWDIVNDRHIWSPETYEIYGVQRGTPLTIDMIMNQFHPDDRRDKLVAVELDPTTSNRADIFEYRIFRLSDGAMRWVHQITSVFFAGSGPERRAVRVLGVVQDITERKQAEQALRESERYLQSIFEGIQEGISILDKEMNIVKANHAMKKWYFHMLPLEGKKCYEAYQGRTIACDDCPSLRAMNEKSLQMSVVPYVNRSGLFGWMELYSSPLMDERGDVIGVIEHVRDITERKRAERELRESEEKFRVLAETSPVIIVVLQGEAIVYANNMAGHLLGYTFSEVRQVSFLELVHPDDREPVIKLWRALQRRERVSPKIEVRVLSKSGEVSWLEVTAGCIYYGGKPALIATAFDITPRKKLMEALEKAKAQSELYLDLMGHDINNIDQIALGYLELARSSMPVAGQVEYLDKSIEVLQRSSLLIKNVRKLQKLNEGVLQTRDVDLCSMLSEVQREFGAVPLKTITLNMNGCGCCKVRANELLYDVFANLISNAIKHTGNDAHIEICLDIVDNNNREHYRVSVADDGPGISDDFKDKIFNRMSRGASPAKGMGLGLYLVKSLVESYGGRVWVEDRIPGDHTKGARFVVMLPAVDS